MLVLTLDTSRQRARVQKEITTRAQHPPERRAHDRHPVRWPVHVSGTGTHLNGAEVCDITSHGLFVHPSGDEPLPAKESRLTLTISPPGAGRRVQAVGTVRWSGHSRAHRCRGFGVLVENSGPFSRLGKLAAGEGRELIGLEKREQ